MRKRKLLRYVLIVIAGLYLVTWIWGVPAVHTSVAASAINTYKAILRRPELANRVSPRHPSVRFHAAFVPLPFVVVSYDQSCSAGTAAWGGVKLYLWLPGHVLEIAWLFGWIA